MQEESIQEPKNSNREESQQYKAPISLLRRERKNSGNQGHAPALQQKRVDPIRAMMA